MMTEQIEILLIASVVAAACALPGVYLVLRKMSMMSDAISHAILLGIVLAFFVVKDITSPFLVIAATITGVLTVSLVELIFKSKLVKEDTAIGLVFPLFFSIGVILIAKFAGNIHLDVDAVLLGELAFAPFNRFEISGVDLGPVSLWVMGGILLLNLVFIMIFYKELKLATFDKALAVSLGFAPGLLHYLLMTLVSVTAVGAFDAVGSVLVVALMIAPPAAAYLLTDHLLRMLVYSVLIGVVSAVSGFGLAAIFDVSIAGSMATMSGVAFIACFLTAPERGLIAQARQRKQRRVDFAQTMLIVHLLNHEDSAEAEIECRELNVSSHLNWDERFSADIIRMAELDNLLVNQNGFLRLTDRGRLRASKEMIR